MRPPRPAVTVLALCLAVAVGLPVAWVATSDSDPEPFGARPAAGSPTPEVPAPTTPATGATPGAPATSSTAPAVPVRLRVARLGLAVPVDPEGVDRHGDMALPADPRRAGWYRYGPRPGDGSGSVVLAGHVDSRTRGLGAFARLTSVRRGDRVTVALAGGGSAAYRVSALERLPKQALPLAELFRRDGPEVLTLVTCGGRYLRDAGGYQDNVVVTAVPW